MGADNSCGEKEAIEGKGLLVAAKGIMGFSVQPRYFLEVVRNASADSGCAIMCHVGRF
jgi:hypothetical protein